ncbi:hypothetical protein PHYBLDRAFT_144545 [Phycomyces blakesleeanus NRRL 1555(-)]|uniref:Ndc10 domain-containing protein n=1 Tax=Phycomyces blakesleeanus (strain ATCC 8743b / DSM 1359 / FGSC 10004 / NBRC 33097 / NRRL 1555) TaxID=763407 RepID=A0A162PLV3_PHYB8|nr:hypothetical protein PHYBLDRAFT_144545 [Phycomyces blakesleeanus NRRL 1555(-)]OAD74087.1 hypothetical protein PHYBLDRAFT_144545 [Phycomyces blakesleeanus NRRL 1555(-)]|eukprot:XP_018292127.1 hypothetical protein PHYBLDRAFT_144545 [Phycomyces blakesleeanus NRRL 1555(-)]
MSTLPVEAIKALAEFSGNSSNFFLARARQKFANGDVQEDIAGPFFLDLLLRLQVVFLQDSALLKKRFPGYYLWTCVIFMSEKYKSFKQQVLSTVQQEEEVFMSNKRMDMVMPKMVDSVRAGFGTVHATMNSMQSMIYAHLSSHATSINRLNNNFTIFFALGYNQFSNSTIATLLNLSLQHNIITSQPLQLPPQSTPLHSAVTSQQPTHTEQLEQAELENISPEEAAQRMEND